MGKWYDRYIMMSLYSFAVIRTVASKLVWIYWLVLFIHDHRKMVKSGWAKNTIKIRRLVFREWARVSVSFGTEKCSQQLERIGVQKCVQGQQLKWGGRTWNIFQTQKRFICSVIFAFKFHQKIHSTNGAGREEQQKDKFWAGIWEEKQSCVHQKLLLLILSISQIKLQGKRAKRWFRMRL